MLSTERFSKSRESVLITVGVALLVLAIGGYALVEAELRRMLDSTLRERVQQRKSSVERASLSRQAHLRAFAAKANFSAAVEAGDSKLVVQRFRSSAIAQDTLGWEVVDGSGHVIASGNPSVFPTVREPADGVVPSDSARSQAVFVASVPIGATQARLRAAYEPIPPALYGGTRETTLLLDSRGRILAESTSNPERLMTLFGHALHDTGSYQGANGEQVFSASEWSPVLRAYVAVEQTAGPVLAAIETVRTVFRSTIAALFAAVGMILLLGLREKKKTAEVGQALSRATAICEASPVGMFVAKASGEFVFANEAFARITGKRAQEALGAGWIEIIAPEDRERVSAEWTDVRIRKANFAAEVSLQRGDGWTVLCEIRAKRVEFAGYGPGYVGTIEDITGRRAQEAELHRQRERLHLALESAREGTWDWDLESGMVVCSEVLVSMLGVDEEQINGPREQYLSFVHPEDLSRMEAALTPHMEGLVETFECEYRVDRKSVV